MSEGYEAPPPVRQPLSDETIHYLLNEGRWRLYQPEVDVSILDKLGPGVPSAPIDNTHNPARYLKIEGPGNWRLINAYLGLWVFTIDTDVHVALAVSAEQAADLILAANPKAFPILEDPRAYIIANVKRFPIQGPCYVGNWRPD